ncbi:MAG: hypothetical protein KJ899_06120 [Gammaproteobacteria bacterium]|nr:hypothetical protein [Gammaproteobacteria bacterium]
MADAVEQEFFDAIDRLLQNKPRNRALAIKAKAGTLQINTTTVALEAGHSRTQIGHDKCKYQKVRAKILGLKNAEAEPHTAEDTIRKLRIRITEVQMELRIANSEKAALIIRMQKTEKAANREIGKAKRSAEQKNRDPNHVVGRSFSDIEAQVIQFPKNDE